jgi:DNA repair protein RadA/Sms
MAKVSSIYRCQQCGATSPKWMGQCVMCKAWNTMVEEIQQEARSKKLEDRKRSGVSRVVKLSEVSRDIKDVTRITTGSGELDRVLGGGMVPGSVVLVAGEPGVGKSTLLTQLALNVGHSDVLYVCGEESVEQIRLRVDRLTQKKKANDLYFLPELNVDQIVIEAETLKPAFMVVDSIQTLSTEDLTGMAGSVGQVRESALRLIELAKRQNITTFLVGHVTKEGTIAGPKVLEHMVDVVLNLTGDEDRQWRFAKTQKNRFGPIDEVGVFEMTEKGMEDVLNPSGIFVEEVQTGVPGSVVVPLMEGTRPILVEIQALAVESQLAMPRRVVNGIPLNKLQVLAAVLQKRCGLALGNWDIFVNVAGGFKVSEPAADLAIALAIASSYMGKPLKSGSAAIGEVGLLGEIRRVGMLKRRQAEAKKLGFLETISPETVKTIRQSLTYLSDKSS